MNEVTRVLSAIEEGDPHAAEQLLPLVYPSLALRSRGGSCSERMLLAWGSG